MQNQPDNFREFSQIHCVAHHRLTSLITQQLAKLGGDSIFTESGRNVRRVVRKRYFGLPGLKRRLLDSPADFIHATVPCENARDIMRSLIATAGLHIPGRGSIYAQTVTQYQTGEAPSSPTTLPKIERTDNRVPNFMTDLSCITAILSMPGSAEQCARMALELGSCVPLITLGEGTGMRDRLGLLRITIPAEKEIVRLLVPEHDSGNIAQLLIEGMRLNKPGSGYIYCTPVSAGMLDTQLNIGFQESAASMEQMIAAIDQLKDGTAWRQRFIDPESGYGVGNHNFITDHREITINCLEGKLSSMVAAALDAGAGGATTFRLRRILPSGDTSASAAREGALINVPGSICDQVTQAIIATHALNDDPTGYVQLLNVPLAFNYRRS